MAVQILEARDVPLGGLRAMTVRRSLPQRNRTLIGAWCFADHYGPDDVTLTGGMDVPPHPHTGLQTVSWLFSGQIEHRDSLGVKALVRPGEMNLMTGGHGICHSEVSTPDTSVLHGVQLWVALPAEHRDAPRDFQHFAPEPVRVGDADVRVFIGELAGSSSPISTFTPLLGAEVVLDAGGTVTLNVDPAFEHGVLVDAQSVVVDDELVPRGAIAVTSHDADRITIRNPRAEAGRVIVLGGPPFGESFVMWWNFVGPDHESIEAARAAWEAGGDRFGSVDGYVGEVSRIPAPVLPHVQLRPRSNRIQR